MSRALVEIAHRASTLPERVARWPGGRRGDNKPDPPIVRVRLDNWCRAVAKGDWEAFRKRLAWDDLDLGTIRAALEGRRVVDQASLPPWLGTLREAIELAATGDVEAEVAGVDAQRFLNSARPLPFEALLVPFVLVARRALTARSTATYGVLAASAHEALERSLLQRLTFCAAHALYLEFSLLRAQERSPLAEIFGPNQGGAERELYGRFVRRMRRGGMVAFFREYAVLARLLATTTRLWVDANAELLDRLVADRTPLKRAFGDDLGPVVAVEPALSDPHRGQRNVMALTFASGRRLVYKPRNSGLEDAYNRLLRWLNDRGAPLPFRSLTVLDRFTHGWTEHVEHLPCSDPDAARRYYRRAGMLLCLIYALEGTDCHVGNIIANGEDPVLVDAEALMHHRVRDPDGADGARAYVLAQDRLARSVLRTGLLPFWQTGPGRHAAYDVSGLGGRGDQETTLRAPKWEHVNIDQMRLVYGRGRTKPRANAPVLNGAPQYLEDYVDEVVDGFRQLYRFLLGQREALLASDGPLQAFRGQQVRFIHRPTRVYGLLLQKLLDPDHLRDGVDRSIQLEQLGRAFVEFEERPCWWPLVTAEQRALEQMDIPRVTARTDNIDVEVEPDQTLEADFSGPSFDLVRAHLADLSEDDLDRQVTIIKGLLYAHRARDVTNSWPADGESVDSATGESLAPAALVDRALVIARELRQHAIRASDGSAAWIAPQYVVSAERYQLRPLGHDLYSGAPGLALFLAALWRITGSTDERDLAREAVQPLCRTLQADPDRLADSIGIGGATGLGSVVYALTRVGQWLDEPAVLEAAGRAASLITTDRIVADERLDVIAGAAGAILGLLAFHGATGTSEALDRARACGEHLLKVRTASHGGYRAWENRDRVLMTGFSHGAAGIAYALVQLVAVTGDTDLLNAAREGIDYERSVFSPGEGNWPVLRRDDAPSFATQWCHGAPGIGLARVGGLPLLDTLEIRQDIETAVDATRRFGLGRVDHLCCGNLGLAEILFTIGHHLGRQDLVAAAESRAASVAARADRSGTFRLHPLLSQGVYVPGLFQGMAGIGYQLLRLARPDVVPSLLLWS